MSWIRDLAYVWRLQSRVDALQRDLRLSQERESKLVEHIGKWENAHRSVVGIRPMTSQEIRHLRELTAPRAQGEDEG